jgi:hypothetical protein
MVRPLGVSVMILCLSACAGNGTAPAIPPAPVLEAAPMPQSAPDSRDPLVYISPTTNVKAPYKCAAPIFGVNDSYLVQIVVSGITPLRVAPNATFSMTAFQAVVTLPPVLVNTLAAAGAKSATATASLIQMSATNAQSATVNAAGTGIVAPTAAVGTNKVVSFAFPTASKTIGTWTAGKAGSVMSFSAGTIDFVLNTTTSTIPFTCTPQPPTTLTDTSIN